MKKPELQGSPRALANLRAWLPLAFIIGALILLLVTPFITQRQIDIIRADIVDLTNEARIAVSDFEGAFAEELVIVSAGPTSIAAADSVRRRAIVRERATQRTLDSVIARMGGHFVPLLDALHDAVREWRAVSPVDSLAPLSMAERVQRAIIGHRVIDASTGLHDQLVIESNRGRDAARRLESIETLISVGLASIALIASIIAVMLERRVRAYAAEADRRARELERSVELRASLINGVVHDVKNPLGAASGFADLLEQGVSGELNERQAEMVGRFKRLIGTALQTVGELVELARVDAGEYRIDKRDTNLVPTLRRIVDDHHAQAAAKSLSLSFDPSVESLWLSTDDVRLRHVIENLLSNAIKYTPAKGKITVGLSVDDGAAPRARVDVLDNGPGIPAEYHERIFDAFYRIPSSEKVVQGTGLGLAISRRIAGLLDGELTVQDAPGGGSDFVLTLPMDRRGNLGDRRG